MHWTAGMMKYDSGLRGRIKPVAAKRDADYRHIEISRGGVKSFKTAVNLASHELSAPTAAAT
jgi:hypothetical protein